MKEKTSSTHSLQSLVNAFVVKLSKMPSVVQISKCLTFHAPLTESLSSNSKFIIFDTIQQKLKQNKYRYVCEIHDDLKMVGRTFYQQSRGKPNQTQLLKIVGQFIKNAEAAWGNFIKEIKAKGIDENQKLMDEKQIDEKIQEIQKKIIGIVQTRSKRGNEKAVTVGDNVEIGPQMKDRDQNRNLAQNEEEKEKQKQKKVLLGQTKTQNIMTRRSMRSQSTLMKVENLQKLKFQQCHNIPKVQRSTSEGYPQKTISQFTSHIKIEQMRYEKESNKMKGKECRGSAEMTIIIDDDSSENFINEDEVHRDTNLMNVKDYGEIKTISIQMKSKDKYCKLEYQEKQPWHQNQNISQKQSDDEQLESSSSQDLEGETQDMHKSEQSSLKDMMEMEEDTQTIDFKKKNTFMASPSEQLYGDTKFRNQNQQQKEIQYNNLSTANTLQNKLPCIDPPLLQANHHQQFISSHFTPDLNIKKEDTWHAEAVESSSQFDQDSNTITISRPMYLRSNQSHSQEQESQNLKISENPNQPGAFSQTSESKKLSENKIKDFPLFGPPLTCSVMPKQKFDQQPIAKLATEEKKPDRIQIRKSQRIQNKNLTKVEGKEKEKKVGLEGFEKHSNCSENNKEILQKSNKSKIGKNAQKEENMIKNDEKQLLEQPRIQSETEIAKYKVKKYKLIIKNYLTWLCRNVFQSLALPPKNLCSTHKTPIKASSLSVCFLCDQYSSEFEAHESYMKMESPKYLYGSLQEELGALADGRINLRKTIQLLNELKIWLTELGGSYLQQDVIQNIDIVDANIIKCLEKIVEYKQLGDHFMKFIQFRFQEHKLEFDAGFDTCLQKQNNVRVTRNKLKNKFEQKQYGVFNQMVQSDQAYNVLRIDIGALMQNFNKGELKSGEGSFASIQNGRKGRKRKLKQGSRFRKEMNGWRYDFEQEQESFQQYLPYTEKHELQTSQNEGIDLLSQQQYEMELDFDFVTRYCLKSHMLMFSKFPHKLQINWDQILETNYDYKLPQNISFDKENTAATNKCIEAFNCC